MIITKPVTKLIVWPFIMVMFTLVFGMIGLRIDEYMNTPPLFATGFLILCFFMIVMRLYNVLMKEVKK
jgi:F0F1-type ATP synthase assembly protein I